MFSPAEITQIKTLLTPEKKVVIISHYNPDGDAVGSNLGLKHGLSLLGVEAFSVVPNDFPKFLKWMPDARKMMIGEFKRKKVYEAIENADVIFCLDFNTLSRIGFLEAAVRRAKATKILIDHHEMPDHFDLMYSDPQQPATCQMVYSFLEALGIADRISQACAESLYTGIMTDTGGFRFRSTSALTHRIVANLIEKGADPAKISSNTFDTNSVGRLLLLSRMLSRVELVREDQVAILKISRAEMEEFSSEKGVTEGFVNYGLSISGVQMAAFFKEDTNEDFIKISFRSKENWDVNRFARKYFNGGGHLNASGGRSEESMDDTIARFKQLIETEEF